MHNDAFRNGFNQLTVTTFAFERGTLGVLLWRQIDDDRKQAGDVTTDLDWNVEDG